MTNYVLRAGIIAVAFVALFISHAQSVSAKHPVREDCACTKEYDPVCANGETYGNACLADCQGFHPEEYTAGACSPIFKPQPTSQTTSEDCVCTKEYDPVCANGETYGNACLARCEGFTASQYTPGACGLDEKPQPTAVATSVPVPTASVPAITPDPSIQCPDGYTATRVCTNMIPEVCTSTCTISPSPTPEVTDHRSWWQILLDFFFGR